MMNLRMLPVWLLLPACGPGAAAEAIRPKDPTASQALGETKCHSVERGAEPLVVDWKPEQRGDLEVAMREGIAVFSYSCDKIQLLGDCHLEGSYGFLGITRKQEMVRLANADELKANLPLTGGSLGGELERGSNIEVAMIMVGKRRTTWQEPTPADLKGRCDGATHYVRSATVGAFVLEQGSQAKVRAAAELFGVGASTKSESSKQRRNQDGDPKDCEKSSPDAAQPPSQCGAPIRLVLAPIARAAEPKDAPPPATHGVETGPTCPEGLVVVEGKCTAPAAAAFQCRPGEQAECTAQCDKGHAGSCASLGAILVRSDEAAAIAPLRKGCDGNAMEACVLLGRLLEDGRGTTKDAAASTKLYEKGCQAGIGAGCGGLGRAYLSGVGVTADPTRAATLLIQGCEGADDESCALAAPLLSEGKGVAKDPARAGRYLHRACAGNSVPSCLALGKLQESGGPGFAKNPALAEFSYRRACFRGSAEGCVELGRFEYLRGPDQAKRYFDQGCARRIPLGCAMMVVGYGDSRPFFPDVAQGNALTMSCNGGNMADCAVLGILEAAAKRPMGRNHLDRACIAGDRLACELEKKLK
jgi:uncharacterized protein